jgi:hypothetical protein
MSTSMIGLAPVRRAISHNIAVTPSDFEDHFSRPYLSRVQDSLYEPRWVERPRPSRIPTAPRSGPSRLIGR